MKYVFAALIAAAALAVFILSRPRKTENTSRERKSTPDRAQLTHGAYKRADFLSDKAKTVLSQTERTAEQVSASPIRDENGEEDAAEEPLELPDYEPIDLSSYSIPKAKGETKIRRVINKVYIPEPEEGRDGAWKCECGHLNYHDYCVVCHAKKKD